MKIEASKTQFALANGCVVVELIANFDDQGTMVFFHCHQRETCHWWIQVSRCHCISNLVSQIMRCCRWAKAVSRRTIMISPSTDLSIKHLIKKMMTICKLEERILPAKYPWFSSSFLLGLLHLTGFHSQALFYLFYSSFIFYNNLFSFYYINFFIFYFTK